MPKTKVAVIGSGNIGTDLVIKLKRVAEHLGASTPGKHAGSKRRCGGSQAVSMRC